MLKLKDTCLFLFQFHSFIFIYVYKYHLLWLYSDIMDISLYVLISSFLRSNGVPLVLKGSENVVTLTLWMINTEYKCVHSVNSSLAPITTYYDDQERSINKDKTPL